MSSLLELQKITKQYGNQNAVDQVSFKIKKGEICGLVGENGAGKTTLLRVLSGLIRQSSGSIHKSTNYRVGALIESPALQPNLPAFENLKYMSLQLNLQMSDDAILNILNRVGLGTVDPKKKSKNFSLGMRQRLAIALAILDNPDFLILDEPINGLDPVGIKEMRNIILNLRDDHHMTILISSHILSELELVVDRYIIMHNGKVIKELPKQLLQQELKEQIYLKTSTIPKTIEVFKKHGISYTEVGEYLALSTDIDTMVIVHYLIENEIDLQEIFSRKISFENYYLKLISKGETHDSLS